MTCVLPHAAFICFPFPPPSSSCQHVVISGDVVKVGQGYKELRSVSLAGIGEVGEDEIEICGLPVSCVVGDGQG